MYIPSIYKSVNQYSSLNFAAGNTDVVITSVNVSYTEVIMLGNGSRNLSGFPCGNGLCSLTLLDATHVRVHAYVAGGDVFFCVKEYYPAFLKQAIQYGLLNISNLLTKTGAVTAVGAKAYANYLGLAQDTAGAQADMGSVTARINLTSTILVTGTRYGVGGTSGTPDTAEIGFCVVDPR